MRHAPLFTLLSFLLIFLCASVGTAQARSQITIVGSSTVFPFATTVAERFGRNSDFKTPIVESTGSGGGIKLFCAGIGLKHPDIVNASRRMKKSEFAKCQQNGIATTEIKIGFDGIVLANARRSVALSLSERQIYLAVAKYVPDPQNPCADEWCAPILNPYQKWSDIDKSLPPVRIEILGPPPTSGTRDAFVELALEAGANSFAHMRTYKKTNPKNWKAFVHGIREDGAWIDSGENDNLMVSKLAANPDAVGVFGFSFLDQNAHKIKGAKINGVAPTFAAIAAGRYRISRSLYIYIKQAHIGVVPGIHAFARAFISERALGDDGYLLEKGLIPLAPAERQRIRKDVENLKKLSF